MKRKLLVFLTIILIASGVIVGSAAASINPASFKLVLSFPDATSASCSNWGYIQFNQSVTFSGGSHTQDARVTDANGNVLYSQSGPTFPDGTYTGYGSFTFATAPTRNPITAVVIFDGVSYATLADIPCLPPGGYAGAPIPDGFVLRTITCDVAVYDQAGGNPVGDNRVTAGQTWYVNPTPVTANGQSWTEIFVAGFTNGYVPTSCVQ